MKNFLFTTIQGKAPSKLLNVVVGLMVVVGVIVLVLS